MESLNRIELIGRVGYVNRNKIGSLENVTFSVATTYEYKAEDNAPVIETTWHKVTAWRGDKITDETLDAIHEWAEVKVVGRLRAIRYTDAEGNERSTYEVLAHEVEVVK